MDTPPLTIDALRTEIARLAVLHNIEPDPTRRAALDRRLRVLRELEEAAR